MHRYAYFCLISEYITFKAVWKKNNYDITFPVNDKIAKLKAHIQTLTGLYNHLHIETSNIINNQCTCYYMQMQYIGGVNFHR